MNDVQIFQQVLKNNKGEIVGKVAILRGGLHSDQPTKIMNEAVSKYVGDAKHNQFINIEMNDPWTRLIISGINKLDFKDYNAYVKAKERKGKLDQLDLAEFLEWKKNKKK